MGDAAGCGSDRWGEVAAMAVEDGARRHAFRMLVAALVVLAGHVPHGWAQEAAGGSGGGVGGGFGGGAGLGGGAAGEAGGAAAGKPDQPAAAAVGGGSGAYVSSPGWTVNLGLTVSETWTDFAAPERRTGTIPVFPPPPPDPTVKIRPATLTGRPDFITQVSPSVSIHGDTPRVSMDLFYAPSATIYAQGTNRNGFGQNLNARAHAMVVENLFYVDVFGYAALVPTLGGQGFSGGIPIGGQPPPGTGVGTDVTNSRQSLSQVYSFGVTPYLIERFGGWGTGKIGASARMTSSGAATYTNAVGGSTRQPAGNTETLQESAEFTSGENLGRFQTRTIVSGQQTTGSGLARNSSNYIAQNTVSYALTRWAAVFGQIGYETISYASANTPFKSNEITWSTGVKFTFGDDGFASIGYGHRYGVNSVSFEGAYNLTARTRITGRYSTGFGTELQLLQADLASSGIDQYGTSVNLDTGAPIFLAGGGAGGGGNQNLYRTQNFSATLSSVVFQDPVSIGVQVSDQTLIASAGVATAFPSKSMSVNASWQHSFGELLGGGLYVVYGKRDLQGLGVGNTAVSGRDTYLATSASLSYTFSPSLVGSARYSYYDQTSNVQFRSYTQNLVMISLSKQF